jgi:hypothetical protein
LTGSELVSRLLTRTDMGSGGHGCDGDQVACAWRLRQAREEWSPRGAATDISPQISNAACECWKLGRSQQPLNQSAAMAALAN